MVLEKTLESPLDCKEIQPVHSKEDQSCVFIGRTDAKAGNSSTLATSCEELTHWKRLWCWEGLGAGGEGKTEDEMVGWHHWLDGHEFEWTPGVGDGQGGLVCCDSWGRKESDTTEQLNWTELNWFLSFIVSIFAWNIPLVSLIFLKRSLVFPILLFSSISLHWSLRKAFLSLCAILWNAAFKWFCLYFSPLPLTSLLFSAICKASSDNHFAFVHFFFLGMVLITASCTMSQTSVHSSSGTLSIRSNPLNLFVTSTI